MLAWAALALAAAGVQPETDWWYVVMSTDGALNAHYADAASIRREGDRVTMAEAREAEAEAEDGIRSSRLEVEYDCRVGAGRIVSAVFVAADGSVVTREQGDGVFIPADPESVAESMLRFACGEGEGLEQLGGLTVREQAELLFRDYRAWLAANAAAD